MLKFSLISPKISLTNPFIWHHRFVSLVSNMKLKMNVINNNIMVDAFDNNNKN